MRRLAGFLLAAALTACSPRPQPANPPLWEMTGPNGARGWLLGTIHALEQPASWKTARVAAAIAGSDTVIVEVADVADGADVGRVFARLSRTPGQPALEQRIPADLRDELAAVLARAGAKSADFADIETWAAAITLARSASPDANSAYGIDRAVLIEPGQRRVIELEGAAGQLGIFDALPETEQRDLLAAIITDAGALDSAGPDLADAWRKGDMARIEAETRRGMLADPELREALFTQRNRAWTRRIAETMATGARPLVAVGAAHMAGPDGLPAMLTAQGFTVRRIQ